SPIRPLPCSGPSGYIAASRFEDASESCFMKRQRFSTFRAPLVRSLIIAVIASGAIALKATPVAAEAALLVDADSGRVLYAENATQPWYPASVTKIMTAFVILNAVKEGRIKFDTPLTVSENAVAQQPSKMG